MPPRTHFATEPPEILARFFGRTALGFLFEAPYEENANLNCGLERISPLKTAGDSGVFFRRNYLRVSCKFVWEMRVSIETWNPYCRRKNPKPCLFSGETFSGFLSSAVWENAHSNCGMVRILPLNRPPGPWDFFRRSRSWVSSSRRLRKMCT